MEPVRNGAMLQVRSPLADESQRVVEEAEQLVEAGFDFKLGLELERSRVSISLTPGRPIYVGAWTRIELTES